MLAWIDWPVLTRQLLLVLVPVLVSRGILPEYLADPVVELATYLIGTMLVGWVIWLGQRRERPAVKIAETAALPSVRRIRLADGALSATIANPKVTR